MVNKVELERLRGEPIDVRVPLESCPFFETSDAQRLCTNPVVSVNMITFNHEKYIGQAIESVVSQETDFEFELLIGEDCSSDRTREICFEYQKKYPDKIRVIWSNENVFNTCGNSSRLRARSRGQFIALCEGDDYWVDPQKLQKQIRIFNENPAVTLCAGDIISLNDETGAMNPHSALQSLWMAGVNPRDEAFADAKWLPTCTAMFPRAVLERAVERFEIFSWRLYLGDVILWQALAYFGDVYVMYDHLGVYRSHAGGSMRTKADEVFRDSAIASIYFSLETGEKSVGLFASKIRQLVVHRCRILQRFGVRGRWLAIRKILSDGEMSSLVFMEFGVVSLAAMILFGRLYWWFRQKHMGLSRRLNNLFIKVI